MAYFLFSVNQMLYIPIASLFIGLLLPPFWLAAIMMLVEILFSLLLIQECKQLPE